MVCNDHFDWSCCVTMLLVRNTFNQSDSCTVARMWNGLHQSLLPYQSISSFISSCGGAAATQSYIQCTRDSEWTGCMWYFGVLTDDIVETRGYVQEYQVGACAGFQAG